MIAAPLPPDERARLQALNSLQVLDTAAEQMFDDIVAMASTICETPIALISLVDADRQWFKARVGLEAEQTPREQAFCAHAILDPETVLVVKDAHEDPRFIDNPLVQGSPHIRFYAGAPVVTADGHAIGTVCAIDRRPRDLDVRQLEMLRVLARQASRLFDLRRHAAHHLQQQQIELEQALVRLTARSERQQQFIYMVSHDLREPVNAIANFCGLLADEVALQGEGTAAPRYLRFIREGSERMRTMLDDLLEFVRLDEATSDPQPVDLAAVLDAVLMDLSGAIDQARASIDAQVSGRVPGQATQLRLLLQNLISNALKFRAPGQAPQVTVRIVESDDAIELRVRDNGIGIPKEHQAKIFGLFRRHVSRRDYPGPGLGLALCERIVDNHGGRIRLESEVGQGTTVTVRLPKDGAMRTRELMTR